MKEHPTLKIACTLAIASLSSLVMIASDAAPPSLHVDDVVHADAGSLIRVCGVAVSVRIWDDGGARLLLADHLSGSTLTVSVKPSPTGGVRDHLHIGDLIRVEGRLFADAGALTLFATASGVTILAASECTLTVDYLCDNWRLFEYDRFNISGVLDRDNVSGIVRLMNPQGDRGILVKCAHDYATSLYNGLVTVDCTLCVDVSTLTMYLRAWAITGSTG